MQRVMKKITWNSYFSKSLSNHADFYRSDSIWTPQLFESDFQVSSASLTRPHHQQRPHISDKLSAFKPTVVEMEDSGRTAARKTWMKSPPALTATMETQNAGQANNLLRFGHLYHRSTTSSDSQPDTSPSSILQVCYNRNQWIRPCKYRQADRIWSPGIVIRPWTRTKMCQFDILLFERGWWWRAEGSFSVRTFFIDSAS